MNPELENLVDIALIDGYISDKEKEVLRRKAANLGFDLDELEMILEGKLYKQNQSRRPKVNKCPSCGEIVNGFSKVCPSCKYILTTKIVGRDDEPDNEDEEDEDEDAVPERKNETLEDSFYELELSVHELKQTPKLPSTKVTNAVFKIVLTAGLYIIYKKLFKKENVFDRYQDVNARYLSLTEMQSQSLLRKYGEDERIKSGINRILADRDAVMNKRRSLDRVFGITLLAVLLIIIYILPKNYTRAERPTKPETALEKTERLIGEKKIGEARAAAVTIDDIATKDALLLTISDMAVDSLVSAGNYDEALRIVNLRSTDGTTLEEERRSKLDKIITLQVTELIEKKEYKAAREKAEYASTLVSYNLMDKIKLAQKLNK